MVRETGDKIQILDQDHDSLALALERALERFGTYLHFDGNQAGARPQRQSGFQPKIAALALADQRQKENCWQGLC